MPEHGPGSSEQPFQAWEPRSELSVSVRSEMERYQFSGLDVASRLWDDAHDEVTVRRELEQPLLTERGETKQLKITLGDTGYRGVDYIAPGGARHPLPEETVSLETWSGVAAVYRAVHGEDPPFRASLRKG